MAKNAGRGRVELSWNLAGQPSGLYNVQWRKRGSTSEWQTAQSYQPRYIITGLEDQTEYEYRIGSVCGNLQTFNNTNPITDGNSAGNAYAFSGIQYFTTDANSTNNNYQCGVMPALDIANKNPLQNLLGANEVFTAGDFPVTVISAQGSNGIYSGTGYIVVPYLADTKIKVSFNNIKLNTDKKLIEGTIDTTYDPEEKNVIGVGDILNDLGNLFDGIVKIIDDAIGNGGMSPKDFDDLSNNLGTYTAQSGSTVSNLYDQGLVSTELKDKIQTEKDKIDNLLKNLNCTKDEKGKGSNEDNFSNEDDCTEKLKELKTLLQNYQNSVNEATANACIWNIAPNENLKGKTFYFQKNVTDKVLHKLKAGDYPVSFNKNGAVYHFVGNGKVYKLFDGQDYYTDKDSKEKYTFESPETEINVSIDETADDKITINGQTFTAGRDCSTDKKDKGNGLGKDVLFTKTVEGKYKVSISKKNGKLASKFELIGKGNSKIPNAQKEGIEQEVQNSMDDVLKDLKNPDELSKIKTDSLGFYVKQMTGKEWITTLSDLGTNVWEEAALPKNYWNEDEAGYKNSTIKTPALFAGVSDGVIGEVSDYPQLVKLGYDVATKEQLRKGMWESVKKIDASSTITMIKDGVKGKVEDYNFSDKPWKGYHTVGKDAVSVATFFAGGFIKKGAKEALEEGVDETGEQIESKVKKELKDYLSNALDKQKELLAKIKRGEIDLNNNFRKGNFGEMATDVDLSQKGYKPLHLDRVTDIDAPMKKGIDGVFEKNGEYFIVESKYSGTSKLKNTFDGPQMGDVWIENRIGKAVDGVTRKSIENSGYRRILSEVSPDGTIIYKELDAMGKVLSTINL